MVGFFGLKHVGFGANLEGTCCFKLWGFGANLVGNLASNVRVLLLLRRTCEKPKVSCIPGAERIKLNCDDGKEGFAILSKRKGHAEGADFRILGITCDNSLTMAAAIDELAKDCKWKIRFLLRCQRHFDIAGTVSLFKGQVLPCVEHRTSAIYHAADSLIE